MIDLWTELFFKLFVIEVINHLNEVISLLRKEVLHFKLVVLNPWAFEELLAFLNIERLNPLIVQCLTLEILDILGFASTYVFLEKELSQFLRSQHKYKEGKDVEPNFPQARVSPVFVR